MLTANDLLEFHFTPSAFQHKAQKIIPSFLNTQFDLRIDKLNEITNELGTAAFSCNSKNFIPHVFKKFKYSHQNNEVYFDRRELRTLTYSLSYTESGKSSIFNNEEETNYALQLINSKWRDSFIIGIIDCYLNNWETENRTSLIILSEFISNKLKSYNGNRSILNSFKKNIKYFNIKNGDLVFGNELALKNVIIQDAAKVLSLPENWFMYPYFSKVMVAYYDKKQSELPSLIDDFEKALDFHKNSVTNKRLLSKFIIQANKPEFAYLQDKVKNLALKYIGDPENKSVWADFHLASEKEKLDLTKARKILNEWLTRQFINVFFNLCINDERRKKFWLKYSPQISSFKVFGPSFTKALLKRDENISKVIDGRFETVSSNRNVSAFILYIGEYMLVEFSDAGYAFYAYKVNGNTRPSLNNILNSVDDLRNGSMHMLIQNDYHYFDEGRLRHHDGNEIWESKFSRWLSYKVIK